MDNQPVMTMQTLPKKTVDFASEFAQQENAQQDMMKLLRAIWAALH